MEVNVTGENPLMYPEMATWHWEVAIYLFLGGLVAGLMVISAVMRLSRQGGFSRATRIADLVGLPLLAGGMLLLWLDLANQWNAWRFFTAFQWTSPMSWGSWILLVSMVILLFRFLGALPMPVQRSETGAKKGFAARLANWVRGAWAWLARLGARVSAWRSLDGLTAVLGVGLGFYTGLLLSTMPARPLWNTSVLAPLFLVSGLASAGAFLCIFITKREHDRLVPFMVTLCGVELLLIFAYALSMTFGMEASQQAGDVLFGGGFGLVFWGLVVLVGLVVPAGVESLELLGRKLPTVVSKILPVLKLTGGVALRLVIVYAGLQTFV